MGMKTQFLCSHDAIGQLQILPDRHPKKLSFVAWMENYKFRKTYTDIEMS